MKNAVFWHVTPCGSCKDRLFGGTYRYHRQGDKNQGAENNAFVLSLLLLLVTANIAPSSPILVTLVMEAIRFSETSILTRAISIKSAGYYRCANRSVMALRPGVSSDQRPDVKACSRRTASALHLLERASESRAAASWLGTVAVMARSSAPSAPSAPRASMSC
jgi:hypothetical protein